MNAIAYINFEHDLEDGWYRMKEPTGANDSWGVCKNAVKFAEEQGWKVEWVGSENYKPDNFPKYEGVSA